MVDLVPQPHIARPALANTGSSMFHTDLPVKRQHTSVALKVTPPHLAEVEDQRMVSRVLLADAAPITNTALPKLAKAAAEVNPLKHNLMRLPAFMNEFFESFNHYFKKGTTLKKVFEKGTYGGAIAYCLYDAGKVSKELYNDELAAGKSEKEAKKKAYLNMFDRTLFHAAASVFGPGAMIHWVNGKMQKVVADKLPKIANKAGGKALVAGTSFAMIPLLIKFLDPAVEFVLKHTTRKWFKLPDLEHKSSFNKAITTPFAQGGMAHTDHYHDNTPRVKSALFGSIFA